MFSFVHVSDWHNPKWVENDGFRFHALNVNTIINVGCQILNQMCRLFDKSINMSRPI